MEAVRRSLLQSTCELLLLIIGKGTYFTKRTGGVYDGDWKDDLRSGFGMYSLPSKDGGFRKVYAGGWKYDKKHVSSIHRSISFRIIRRFRTISFRTIVDRIKNKFVHLKDMSCIPVLINMSMMFIKVK